MAASALSFEDVRAAGFPVYSLSEEDRLEQLCSLLLFDRTTLIHDRIIAQSMHGLALSWHYHPHAWGVRCGGKRTPLEVFGDDDLLQKALTRRVSYGKCVTKSDLRKTLRAYSGTQSVSNFRPTAAAAIYDRYVGADGGVVWDMSAGYGGRLLGALACGKVTRYIGTDPAPLTMDGLREMRDDLVPTMRCLGCEPPVVELHRIGSEEFQPEQGSLDLCFTSPPYAGHEQYSDEPTQSYVRFPSNKEWLHGYMQRTLENCRIGSSGKDSWWLTSRG